MTDPGTVAASAALPEKPRVSAEDRYHGYAVLVLFNCWDDWIKRRTEQVDFVGDGAVRRTTAVDFTLRERLLHHPYLWWGQRGMHYMPIALLAKHPLTDFALRDEDDRVIPLLTRMKSAAMSAAMLMALAQSIVAHALERGASGRVADYARKTVMPHRVELHPELEAWFLALAYLPYRDVGAMNPVRNLPRGAFTEARQVYAAFAALVEPAAEPPPPERWDWTPSGGDGYEQLKASAPLSYWAAMLVADASFRELAATVARGFLLCVPVEHEPTSRRVFTYSYQELITEPALRLGRGPSGASRGMDAIRAREQQLEGLPGSVSEDEWRDVEQSAPPQLIGPGMKLLRGIGWRAKWFAVEAPAVGWGSPHHFEVVSPEGLQLRRVGVSVIGRSAQRPRVRATAGARNNSQLQAYVTDAPRGAQARAEVALKPRSATVVRGAALTAIMTVAALIVTVMYLPEIQGTTAPQSGASNGSLDVTAGLLLVIPGLLAVYVARGDEHPMTTSMLYGLRMLAGFAGTLAVIGAGLMLIGPATGIRLVLWVIVILSAFVTAVVLAVAWRLSARGRRLEHLLPEPLREAGVGSWGR